MLRSVYVHNYRSFVDTRIDFERCTGIVSDVGAGVTSLVELLERVVEIVTRGAPVSCVFGASSRTPWLKEPVQRFAMEIERGGVLYTYHLDVCVDEEEDRDDGHEEAWVVQEALSRNGRLIFRRTDFAAARGRPPAGHRVSPTSSVVLIDNSQTAAFGVAVERIVALSIESRGVLCWTPERGGSLGPSGRDLVGWFGGVAKTFPDVFGRLTRALQPWIKGLRRLRIEDFPSGYTVFMATFSHGGVEYDVDHESLSDGERTLLLLYAVAVGGIATERVTTLFVDGPELGLAPHALGPLCAALEGALREGGGQLIVASKHPAVLDAIAPRRALLFARPRGGPTVVRSVDEQVTGGLRVSEWIATPAAFDEEHEHEETNP